MSDVFWELCHEADEAWHRCDFASDWEPIFAKMLNLVRANEAAHRTALEDLFIEALRTQNLRNKQMLSYCMHDLRWPRVREAVREKLNEKDADPRADRIYADIDASFEDDWEDRGLYRHYQA